MHNLTPPLTGVEMGTAMDTEYGIYKSLFIENTVASKKHISANINTNKAKTTTKSITVVDTWY